MSSTLSSHPEHVSEEEEEREEGGLGVEESESEESVSSAESGRRTGSVGPWQWPKLSRLHKNVLKCALAYLIASLFTFVPYLSGFLSDIPSRGKGGGGPSPSGHMVATV